jgi:hypothetical protein
MQIWSDVCQSPPATEFRGSGWREEVSVRPPFPENLWPCTTCVISSHLMDDSPTAKHWAHNRHTGRKRINSWSNSFSLIRSCVFMWWSLHCPNGRNWRAHRTSSRFFQACLPPAFIVTYRMALPDIFAVCSTVTNQPHLQVTFPFKNPQW